MLVMGDTVVTTLSLPVEAASPLTVPGEPIAAGEPAADGPVAGVSDPAGVVAALQAASSRSVAARPSSGRTGTVRLLTGEGAGRRPARWPSVLRGRRPA